MRLIAGILLLSFLYAATGYDIYYEKPKDDYYSSYDTSFVSGDSPATLNVFSDLGRMTYNGEVNCDGDGTIYVKLSSDGSTYEDNILLKNEETLDLKTHRVKIIVITHTGTDSSYRVRVW